MCTHELGKMFTLAKDSIFLLHEYGAISQNFSMYDVLQVELHISQCMQVTGTIVISASF